MKNSFLSVLLLCTLLPFYSDAKVWRINNNPGILADFTTAQAAASSAAVGIGDTLHIEPSSINYGNLVLTKKLTILSIGNFLTANPGLQYAAAPGTMAQLTVNAGAAGSVLSCSFSGTATITGCNNIRLERSYILGVVTVTNADSIVIIDTYCDNQIFLRSNSNNVMISNSFTYVIDMDADCSTVITNNILGKNKPNFFATFSILNSIFENNVIVNTQGYFYTNSIAKNNLTNGGTGSLPAGNGNQTGVNMANVFVNPTGTSDKDYLLISGSLATGTGANGEDLGVFGGATPFKLGIQPAIPAIYKLNAPATTVGNSLNIVFSTRSNN